mmetsp:Transcript_89448/g.144874  ORF Transcript_89448/g.144874 Transcript_89448/m.144874 type:complete len:102 (+) Transcript_89448:1076-1381(+)
MCASTDLSSRQTALVSASKSKAALKPKRISTSVCFPRSTFEGEHIQWRKCPKDRTRFASKRREERVFSTKFFEEKDHTSNRKGKGRQEYVLGKASTLCDKV